MALASGTKFGPYEIQSPLGAGGMGEVYRARDTRLDRCVAIKVLASHLSSSPELRQRMEREARAISSLNHPHICHLYDIGSQNGTDYLVMELLEGETLADRLRKGAMPMAEIHKIGVAIAEALAVAHKQGVVHRDLKPGNIMLTPAGAKLMDFGLAKPLAMQTATSGSAAPAFTAVATLSGPSPLSPLTTAGSIIGTIQYMSPEQIEGKEADARSDIFAFGAVLYEMATGKRPFTGKSQISLASSILESDPQPISVIKPLTPPAFEHVVTACLQKNPDERFQTAHDIKLELQWIASDKSTPARVGAEQGLTSSKRERVGWAAGVIAALVVGAITAMLLYRPTQPVRAIQTVINPPEKTALNLTGDAAGPPVLSPDGTTLAFTATGADGKTALWVRPMNSPESRMLPDTDDVTFPFWSPDNHSLGFFSNGKLKTIDISGGSSLVLCDAPNGRGGAWGPGGVILFTPTTQSPIMRVSSAGGTPVAVTTIIHDQHTSHRWPFFLPDGKHFLYVAIQHDVSKAANNTLYHASLDGHESRALFRSQSNAVYARGFLLFARGDQLTAQTFDPADGTLSGQPQTVARGVMNDSSTWHMDASASNDGLLVLGSGGSGDLQLLWMDRGSKQIAVLAEKIANLLGARLSPQGDRVAMQIDVGAQDIWVLDLARGVRTRLTFGPIANANAVWSPDGQWIAYSSPRSSGSAMNFNIYRKRSDGSGGEEVLFSGDDRPITSTSWSRDGQHIFYTRQAEGHGEVWDLALQGERKPSLLVPWGGAADISPNGRWLAYNSAVSGATEVYVVAYGGGQGKWQVSANGGSQPQWSKDGKELYYVDPAFDLLAVTVKEVGGALQFGAPQILIPRWSAPNMFYDVSSDGKKILLDRVAQQVNQSVTVVSNFQAELKKQ